MASGDKKDGSSMLKFVTMMIFEGSALAMSSWMMLQHIITSG
jgi:hypothetical protein